MNREIEMRHFFMIMSGLGVAKAATDLDAVIEWIEELEMMAAFAAPVFANRAAYEADQARNWHDDMATGLPIIATRTGNVSVFAAPAPSH